MGNYVVYGYWQGIFERAAMSSWAGTGSLGGRGMWAIRLNSVKRIIYISTNSEVS